MDFDTGHGYCNMGALWPGVTPSGQQVSGLASRLLDTSCAGSRGAAAGSTGPLSNVAFGSRGPRMACTDPGY
jgi:hypothetical protein